MSFTVFLIIGMVGMLLSMLYCGHQYHMPIWKIAFCAAIITISGVLGAYLMGFIESGNWGGRSYFGAVFFVPIIMWIAAKRLKLPYGHLMDVCAPAGCIMLAVLKIKCNIDGCCGGRFFALENGELFRFPSQIVESIVGLFLAIAFIWINKKGTKQSMVYPLYLLSYGVARFILSFFRYPHPWIGSLPAGAFWSLISIAVGLTVLFLQKKKRLASLHKS